MANNSSTNGKKSSAQLTREVDEVLRMRQKKQATAAAAPQPRSSIPGQAEYERREVASAHRKLDDLRRAPLADRKEAQAKFLGAMRDHPEIVGERIGWLLGGNYGYGQMLLAKQVLASPRMNRSAALTQMVGAYEWQSPEELSRAAWKKLSASEQAQLEREVQEAIASAERDDE
jgi:hypothetical protein